jgi:two-component system sensor kinase FixL
VERLNSGPAPRDEIFQDIADFAPAMLWRINSTFNSSWANRTWFSFTGGTLESELDFAWADRIHPDERERVLEQFDIAFSERTSTVVEFRIRRYDGAYRWLLDRGEPVYRDGKFDGFVGSAVDITERREAELRADRLQAEVVRLSRADVSGSMANMLLHELVQPVQVISNYSAALKRMLSDKGDLAEPISEGVDRLRAALERAGEIVRSCRDLAAGSPSERAVADLAAVLRAAEPHISELPHGKAGQLEWSLEPGLRVNVSAVQIEQVLLNLVKNAIEAMQGAPARVRVAAAAWGREAIVSVTDWGPGINPDIRAEIFEQAVTTKPDGMGVGLHVCRAIITAHGGRIWVSDNFGAGTTVKFTLPLA